MATFKIHPDVVLGGNMRGLDFSTIYDGYDYAWSSTIFRAYYSDGTVDEFRGTGFSYDDYGVPTGGTVSGYAGYYDDVRILLFDGIRLAAKDIVKAAGTYSLADDWNLIKATLAGNDTVTGAKGGDKLWAHAGNDVLLGNAGNDSLYGGSGADKITGGIGHDYLRGETGSDTFIYKSIKESTVGSSGRDTIYDLTSGDKIDLSAIDASTKYSGNQSFNFIGTTGFTGKAGDLRYEKKASDTYIYADVNGDKNADFAIHLDDALTLSKGYFVL